MFILPYDLINHTFTRANRFTFASSLFDLCSSKCSGTLFMKTCKSGTAIFVLQNGIITDLTLRSKRNLDAITTLKGDNFKHIEFHEGYFEPTPLNAKVSCSQTLLTHLGYDQFIVKNKSTVYLSI